MFEVLNINKSEDIKRHYSSIESVLRGVFYTGKKRCNLYYCNAEIWECMGILALVSFGTPIALFTPDDGSLYDCLRIVYGYTVKSSQHVFKFKKWLAENNYPVQYAVRFIN